VRERGFSPHFLWAKALLCTGFYFLALKDKAIEPTSIVVYDLATLFPDTHTNP